MKQLLFPLLLIFSFFGCQQEGVQTEPLKADFTYVNANGLCKIVNASSKNATRYQIDFGNGDVLSGEIKSDTLVVYRFPKSDNYSINFTVYDNQRKSASTSKNIAISVFTAPENTQPPVADFSYELLADGSLKLINTSKNAYNYVWSSHSAKMEMYNGGNELYNSKQPSPTFIYEANGKYYITLTAINNVGESIKKDSVEIKDAIAPARGEFNGTFFDKTGNFKGSQINTYKSTWGAAALYGNSCYNFENADLGSIFIITGQSFSHNDFKNQFKVDGKPINWGQVIVTKGGSFLSNAPHYNLSRAKGPEVTIVKVEELPQPQLFPEMEKTAFWVTFKIKADFGDTGKIDGTLKSRFLVY